MPTGRVLAVAVAVFAVLWLALDSGWMSAAPAPPGTSVALGMLAAVFAVGAWMMQAGGRTGRVPMLVGMALGVGAYALVRAVAH